MIRITKHLLSSDFDWDELASWSADHYAEWPLWHDGYVSRTSAKEHVDTVRLIQGLEEIYPAASSEVVMRFAAVCTGIVQAITERLSDMYGWNEDEEYRIWRALSERRKRKSKQANDITAESAS